MLSDHPERNVESLELNCGYAVTKTILGYCLIILKSLLNGITIHSNVAERWRVMDY